MPNPLLMMMGLSAGSSIIGAGAESRAADNASAAQLAATQLGIDEQKRQFDAIQKLYQPYIGAGSKSLGGMMDLTGLNGRQDQRGAIAEIANSPEFAALRDQGFNAISQNAAATGGLRGGNTEAALAQFAPNMLQDLIDQRYSRLGGIATMGQNSAAGEGAAGQAMANNVTQLYGQQGAAQAGNYLAQGKAKSQMWGGIAGAMNYGLGRAMAPAMIAGPNGGQIPNPAALPGGLFESWKAGF